MKTYFGSFYMEERLENSGSGTEMEIYGKTFMQNSLDKIKNLGK
jgi:hypothetical protein